MVPDRQKVRTDGRKDGRNGRTDGQTPPKLYPSDFVGDKKVFCMSPEHNFFEGKIVTIFLSIRFYMLCVLGPQKKISKREFFSVPMKLVLVGKKYYIFLF